MRFFSALFFFIVFAGIAQGQELSQNNFRQASIDSLIAKYMGDTLHASQKINELRVAATKLKDNVEGRLNAIQYYQIAFALEPYARDSIETLSHLYASFAGLLSSLGALDQGIQQYKISSGFFPRLKNTQGTELFEYHVFSNIAGNYINQPNSDSAIAYYQLASDRAQMIGAYLWIASSINNLGCAYLKFEQDSLAEKQFVRAGRILQLHQKEDSLLRGSINDNLAEIEAKRNNWHEALALYDSNIHIYGFVKEFPNWVKAIQGRIQALIKLGGTKQAGEELNALSDFMLQNKSKLIQQNYVGFYNLKKNYFIAINNMGEAVNLQQKITSFNDSIGQNDKKLLNALYRALASDESYKFSRDIQIYQMQLADAHQKAQRSIIIIIGTSLFSAAILILLSLYFRNRSRIQQNEIRLQQYRQQITEQELRNQKLEQEKLEQELAYRKGDLNELGVYLSKMKGLHEEIAFRIREIHSADSQKQKEVLRSVAREIDMKMNMEDQAVLVQQNMDKLNTEFYQTLLKRFPDLTKAEVELCGLLRLKMSNKEIAALKNISYDSVKRSRNRLRRKIGVDADEDLYTFITRV